MCSGSQGMEQGHKSIAKSIVLDKVLILITGKSKFEPKLNPKWKSFQV